MNPLATFIVGRELRRRQQSCLKQRTHATCTTTLLNFFLFYKLMRGRLSCWRHGKDFCVICVSTIETSWTTFRPKVLVRIGRVLEGRLKASLNFVERPLPKNFFDVLEMAKLVVAVFKHIFYIFYFLNRPS